MSTDTQKYSVEQEKEAPHSAFDEFGRDERRPAVLLLAGLVIAAIFFALGIMFGRWTDRQRDATPTPTSQQGQSAPVNQTTPTPLSSPSPSPSRSQSRQTAQPSPRRSTSP